MRSTAFRGFTRSNSATAVPLEPNFGGARVRSSPSARASVVIAGDKLRRAVLVELLHRNDLDVIGSRESAANTRRATRRQNVIGTRGIVARSLRAERSHENTAGMTNLLQQRNRR